MTISKREFLRLSGATAALAAIGTATADERRGALAAADLQSITDSAIPISVDERLARIAKAQKLMAKFKIDAVLVEPGSAMEYFSGIRWWRSERLTALVIPRKGEIAVVTPYFEEPSVRESMTFGQDVRTWHEHEDPFERVAGVLKDRGLRGGCIGLEDTVR